MLQTFFLYLLKSSLCLLLFAAFFKIVLQKQTFFTWNRYYLLASIMLSIIIPLLKIPAFSHTDSLIFNIPLQTYDSNKLEILKSNSSTLNAVTENQSLQHILIYLVLALYLVVVLINLVRFIHKLVYIKRLISDNTKMKEQHYWIVSIQNSLPAFSFFRYIFINKELEKINKNKFETIKQHELIHVNQMHSLDNIFFEILLLLFWFNPIMYFYKKSLHEIHEFIVDEKLTKTLGNRKEYSQLLLNLAIQTKNMSPVIGFSTIKINKRINMLNKQRSKAIKKILFLLTLPLIGVSLLSFSVSKKNKEVEVIDQTSKIEKLIIGNINWEGNTAYSDAELSKALGLKSGDEYNYDVDNRINGDNSKILKMYMDNGYVFYHATHNQSITDNIADITITIEEHTKGVIGKVAITGNKKVPEQEILNKMKFKKGELFNRSKITKSVEAINKMKRVRFKNIYVLPEHGVVSNEGYAVINLEFIVSEK